MCTLEQSLETSDLILSPSEKRTLQHLAQGELHVSELDWVALQRLKRLRLAEERGRVTSPHGRGPARDATRHIEH